MMPRLLELAAAPAPACAPTVREGGDQMGRWPPPLRCQSSDAAGAGPWVDVTQGNPVQGNLAGARQACRNPAEYVTGGGAPGPERASQGISVRCHWNAEAILKVGRRRRQVIPRRPPTMCSATDTEAEVDLPVTKRPTPHPADVGVGRPGIPPRATALLSFTRRPLALEHVVQQTPSIADEKPVAARRRRTPGARDRFDIAAAEAEGQAKADPSGRRPPGRSAERERRRSSQRGRSSRNPAQSQLLTSWTPMEREESASCLSVKPALENSSGDHEGRRDVVFSGKRPRGAIALPVCRSLPAVSYAIRARLRNPQHRSGRGRRWWRYAARPRDEETSRTGG